MQKTPFLRFLPPKTKTAGTVFTVILTTLIILTSHLSMASDTANQPGQWHKLFNSGKKLMNEGKYQEAVDDLIGSLSFDPDNPRTLALLGTIFYRLGKPEKARFHWERGLIYNPQSKTLLELLQMVYKTPLPNNKDVVSWKKHHDEGENLLLVGRIDEALRQFDTALKFFPGNRYSVFSKGMAYYQKGEIEKARAQWKSIQKDDPDNVMVRDLLRVLNTNKKSRRAYIETELAKNPDDWKLLFDLGALNLKEQKLNEAKHYFQKALSLNEWYGSAVLGLAMVAFASNDYTKSIDILKKALKKSPDERTFLAELSVVTAYKIIMDELKSMLEKEKSDPTEMVKIPAGEFIFGDYDPDTNIDERPVQHIDLQEYYINKYEISNIAYYEFIKDSTTLPPAHWKGNKYPENEGFLPVINVNWYEADAYCRWAGMRLPTEQEWEKAARGVEGLRFPWGDAFDTARANTRASSFRRPLHIASYSSSTSPYGVFNMAGNVWEWTADWYNAYPGSDIKRKEFGEKYRVQRGGAFLTEPILHARTSERDAQLPIYRHRTTGFRCAK